ncbi:MULTISPECIES: hypothetical protein [Pseudomonas]|uniref:Uncharacterized protein n=1 Tax=Pseudomonas lutea TaxID=243924 RepID=A0A9X8QLQ9_9PSED|nr:MULTISPECIES: hypothetical protein [Pseudomonas]SER36895.1 hypothetical protein SAMN05216409_11872 [Pseudomonas lutea]
MTEATSRAMTVEDMAIRVRKLLAHLKPKSAKEMIAVRELHALVENVLIHQQPATTAPAGSQHKDSGQ